MHNSLHVPVVSYNKPIDDGAAVEFARSFYRAWRRSGDVTASVARGRESLAVLYPDVAPKVKVINGDMITPARFSACVDEITARLGELQGSVRGQDGRMERLEGEVRELRHGRAWVSYAMVGLLVLLLVAQCATVAVGVVR